MKKKFWMTAVAMIGLLLFLAEDMPVCAVRSGREVSTEQAVQQQAVRKAEQLPMQALEKLKKAESMHAVLNLDLEVEVFGINLDARAVSDMIAFRAPHLLKSEINLDLGLLGETGQEMYIREGKSGYEVYAYAAEGWDYKKIPATSVRRYDGLQMMQTYLEQITDWRLQEISALASGKARLYYGVVKGEGLKEILLNTESMEVVQELLEETALKPFAAALGQKEKLQSMMETAADLPICLWIDIATGYPVRCEMDITKMLSDAYQELVDSLRQQKVNRAGLKLLEAIDITETKITILCDDYNEAEAIMLPKAALEARMP